MKWVALVLVAMLGSGCPAADWEIAANALTGYGVGDVAIDPTDPAVLYCACRDGVFKSTSGGASWVKSSAGLPSGASAGLLQIDPSNSSRIYVLVNEGTGTYVWRSDNAAASWTRKSTGITLPYLASLEISPSNTNIVYCGTIIGGRDGGCYRSIDYGDTWVQVAGSNMPGTGLENDCAPIAVDPENPDRLYCGRTYYNDLLRSTDGGTHWTWSGQNYLVRALLVDPENPNRVFAAGSNNLRYSANYGQSFTTRIAGGQFSVLAYAPGNRQVFYAGTSAGIYRSDDAGVTWGLVSGSERYPIARLRVHPSDPDTLYCVVSGRGIAKSVDGGATFSFLNSGLTTENRVRFLAEQEGTAATYALVDYVGLYRTYDQGASWHFLSSVPFFPKALAFDAQNPSTLYYVAYPANSIYRSTDSGFTWNPLPTSPADDYFVALAVDPADSQKLFVAGFPSNKIYRTLNGGATWETVLTVTPMPDWWSTSIWHIAIDPADPDRVYVSTYSYPRRSTDGGTTWQSLTSLHYDVLYGDPGTWHDTSDIRHMAIDPTSPNTLYACTQWGGTWKSTDYGDTWSRVYGDHLYITNNVIIDSRDPNTLYMSSLGGYSGIDRGIKKSVNGGASWNDVSTGLVGNDSYPNLVHQSAWNPDRFYVAASLKGIYRTPGGGWGLPLPEVKAMPDQSCVLLSEELVVSQKYPDGSGCLQREDRLEGIIAANLGDLQPGDRARVLGILSSEDANRWLHVQQATVSSHSDPPFALSMAVRERGRAPAPTGIFTRAWGRVSYCSPDGGYYYLDDGSGLVDGSGHAGLKVRCEMTGPIDQGTYAVLEGILAMSWQDDEVVPCLIVSGMDGIIWTSPPGE